MTNPNDKVIASLSDDGLWLKYGAADKSREVGLAQLQSQAKKKTIEVNHHLVMTTAGSTVRPFVLIQVIPLAEKKRQRLRRRVKYWQAKKIEEDKAIERVANEESLSVATLNAFLDTKIAPVDMLANLVTGSLFDPKTGQCLSGTPKIAKWHV